MIPNTAFALDAVRVGERTFARVSRQTLATVTNPRFAKVADSSLKHEQLRM